MRKLFNVSIQRKWVGDSDSEEKSDDLTGNEEFDESVCVLAHDRLKHSRNRISENDTERTHALCDRRNSIIRINKPDKLTPELTPKANAN